MAIWDTAATVSLNCPSCGDALRFDSAIKASVCRSCGNVYEPGTLNVTGKLKFVDVNNASEEEENKREYVCGSCGATVVTDENTAATFCAFCGSPSVMGRRLAKEFRPDSIIPFKITREEAVKKFTEWVKTNKLAPKDMLSKNTLNKITGLYVPFWLLNADCHAFVTGMGFLQESAEHRSAFSISRKMIFKVKNVPFDGCLKISNFLMNAIEPFDFSELCPYDDAYLPGYYADRYDRNALDLTEVIDIRLSKYASQAGDLFVKSGKFDDDIKYTSVITDSTESYVKNLSQSYALLPVWFLNYEYNGDSYQIAINGQTGKVSGELPRSKVNELKFKIVKSAPSVALFAANLILAIVFFIMVTGVYTDYIDAAHTISYSLAAFFFFALWVTGPMMIKKIHAVDLESIDQLEKAPDVSEYFDYSTTPKLVSKEDKFIGVQVRLYSNENSREREPLGWTFVG